MSELAVIQPNATPALPEQVNFARMLADASLLPRAYQRQPANVLLAMQMGYALGLSPVDAINSIHVIEGKPSMSADLMAALVRRAGHKLRIREEATQDGPRVTATLIRRDDPDFEFVVVWDRAKARAANLHGKGNWKTYEAQMMRNRAVTEVARQGASDVLHGVIYDPEELGGIPPASHSDQQVTPASPISPMQPEPEPDTPISREQMQELGALMKSERLTKSKMLEFAADVTGRKIGSAEDLTSDEAALVIEALRSTIDAPADVDAATGEVVDAEVIEDGQPAFDDAAWMAGDKQ